MAFPASAEEVRETLKRIQKNLECPICLELLSDPYSTQCSHPFCRSCIYMVISSSKEARCPLCKEPISKRSMNENARLADIVEAVKSLEQAIIKDSGIQSTPPRPLHQHSHEASGTPGLILHSLLHPTPRKPAPAEASSSLRPEKRQKDTAGCGPTTSSGAQDDPDPQPAASRKGKKAGLCPRQDLEKKFNFNPSRKRVRFAGARSSKRTPGSGRVSNVVDQAALLRVLEEEDFAEPEHRSMTSNPDLEQRPGYGTNCGYNTISSSVNSTASDGDRVGSSLTDSAIASPTPHSEHYQHEKTPTLSTHSPGTQQPRPEPHPVPAQLSGYRTADIDPRQPPSGMSENLTVVQETPFHTNQPSSDSFHGNNILESPLLDVGNHAGSSRKPDNAGKSVLLAATPVQATAAVAEETEQLRSCTSERSVEEEATAPRVASGPEYEATPRDDIITKESQFTDDPMDVSTPAVNLSERTAPETQTVEETQMNVLPTSVAAGGATETTSSSSHEQCSGPIEHALSSVSPTQCIKETQVLQVHEGSNQSTSQDGQSVRAPDDIVSLPQEEDANISRSGDSTQSLSPPAFVREPPFQNTPPTSMPQTPFRKTPPTICKTPPTVCTYSSSRSKSKDDLNSTGSTTPDLKDLQSITALSPPDLILVSGNEVPICSSPKSTAIPICRPCFTSPPSHGHLATPSPSLNHSISPSIPLQNYYQNMSSHRERVVIPDTFPNFIPPPSIRQRSSDSVPSSQQSPAVVVYSPALPGLFPHTSVASCAAEDPELASCLSPAGSGTMAGCATLPLPVTRNTIPAGDYLGPSSTHHSDSVTKALSSDRDSSPAILTLSGSVPNSVTVIPDSLHPHSPDHTSPNPDTSPTPTTPHTPENDKPSPDHTSPNPGTSPTPTTPHTPGNDKPSPEPLSPSLSDEMQSLDSNVHDTLTSAYTQWDSSCKSYLSQGLTSQEVEALRAQMEEKEREIQELEALLLAKTSNAVGAKDNDGPERGAVAPSVSDCCSHTELVPAQTSDGLEPCGSHTHKGDHTPSQTQNSISSAEVTVIAETVPDSLPLCNTLGPELSTESNSAVSKTSSQFVHESADRSLVLQPRSTQNSLSAVRCNRSDRDKQESTGTSPAMHTTNVGLPASENNIGSSIPSRIPADTDQQQEKMNLLLQRADDLIRAFQCPPSVNSSQSESQAPGSKVPECSRPSVTGPHANPLVDSGKAVSRRKRKIGSLEHAQKNTSAMNAPPKRTKKSPIDQFVTRPSPVATKSSVLQAADRLLKALRNPPKVILESQTTMEVDAALVSSTSKAHSHTREIRENIRTSGSKKKTPKGLLRRPEDTATKRRAPLVVLDLQDVETYSPPPLNRPLPKDHPFLSISTSKHHQAPVIDPRATTTPYPTTPGCQPHLHSPQGYRRSSATPTSGQPKPSNDGSSGPSIVVTPGVQLSGVTMVTIDGSSTEGLKSGPQTPSFVGSGLSKAQLKRVQLLAKMHRGRLASCFNGSTTHVIVLTDENGCCPRTVKYLQGVAARKWIVSYEWINNSLEAGQLMPERDYEALGDHLSGRGSSAPLRSRSSLAAGEPGLFNRHNFLLVGLFTAASSDYLSQLVQLGGGRVIANMDSFLPPVGSQTLTVCDQTDNSVAEALGARQQRSHATVTSSWILDSISQYRLQPVERYQLKGQ